MRCFACNMEVNSESLDRPTGRFYCNECFSWTNDEIYRNSGKKLKDDLAQYEPIFEEVSEEEFHIFGEGAFEYYNVPLYDESEEESKPDG